MAKLMELDLGDALRHLAGVKTYKDRARQTEEVVARLHECGVSYLNLATSAAKVWDIADIQTTATERGYKFSDELARECLLEMLEKHDAGIGINWDTVTFWVSEYESKAEEISED